MTTLTTLTLSDTTPGIPAMVGLPGRRYAAALLHPRHGAAGASRGQIEAVRVHEAYRSRGLGSRMFAWAVEESRSRGCALVQLTTDRGRVEAHRVSREAHRVSRVR